jgi:importin-5
MRQFSLVLLRRLLFRSAPISTSQQQQQNLPQHSGVPSSTLSTGRQTLYDQLSSNALTTLERLLLFSLAHETSATVRRKSVDTVCDVASEGMGRGRPWHALQAQSFTMSQAGLSSRESAFRVFAGCPNLVMDLQIDAVLAVFQRGLQDPESIEVSAVDIIIIIIIIIKSLFYSG